LPSIAAQQNRISAINEVLTSQHSPRLAPFGINE
jgi:hypothetical protein